MHAKDAQNSYFTKYTKKNMHKINAAKFFKSINNKLV